MLIAKDCSFSANRSLCSWVPRPRDDALPPKRQRLHDTVALHCPVLAPHLEEIISMRHLGYCLVENVTQKSQSRCLQSSSFLNLLLFDFITTEAIRNINTKIKQQLYIHTYIWLMHIVLCTILIYTIVHSFTVKYVHILL